MKTITRKDKKLPCPFCGDHNIGIEAVGENEDGTDIWFRCVCLNCTAKAQKAGTKEGAVNNWNERA